MHLDIRLPIGFMFITFGVILTLFGVFGNKSIYSSSLGININLGWGLVLMGFGGVMLLLGWRAGHGAPERRDAVRAERQLH